MGYSAALASLELGYHRSRYWRHANVVRVSQGLHCIFAKSALHAGDETAVLVVFFKQIPGAAGTPLEPEHIRIPSHCPVATEFFGPYLRIAPAENYRQSGDGPARLRAFTQLGIQCAGSSSWRILNLPICYSYVMAGVGLSVEECHLSVDRWHSLAGKEQLGKRRGK